VLYSSAGDEKRLCMIGKAVDHFFERCEHAVEHTNHPVRCWLRSHIPKRPYNVPLELPVGVVHLLNTAHSGKVCFTSLSACTG
jgi:hypothetical protein